MILLLTLSACVNVFFRPDHHPYFSPSQWGLAYTDVYLTTVDGVRLHAWWLPAAGAPKGNILFLHGNAQNISGHVAGVAWLPQRGYNVFLLDYRGYGRSQGTPQLPGVFADIDAAVAYLRQHSDAGGLPLVIFGQSLGGALAITAAAKLKHKTPIAAVISDSAFSGYRDIAREKLAAFWLTRLVQWPLSFLFSDAYSPSRFVAQISPIPLLIIQGEQDYTVPSTHARRLYGAAGEPKALWALPGVGHIQALNNSDQRERLIEWLDERVNGKMSP